MDKLNTIITVIIIALTCISGCIYGYTEQDAYVAVLHINILIWLQVYREKVDLVIKLENHNKWLNDQINSKPQMEINK